MWEFIKEFYRDAFFDLGSLAMLQKYWVLHVIAIGILVVMYIVIVCWSAWRDRAS